MKFVQAFDAADDARIKQRVVRNFFIFFFYLMGLMGLMGPLGLPGSLGLIVILRLSPGSSDVGCCWVCILMS